MIKHFTDRPYPLLYPMYSVLFSLGPVHLENNFYTPKNTLNYKNRRFTLLINISN